MNEESAQLRNTVVSRLYSDLRGVGLLPIDETIERERPISDYRRSRVVEPDDGVGLATLVDEDGVFVWEPGPVTRAIPTGMRRGRPGAGFTTGEPVATVKYEKLGFSQVAGKLQEFDRGFTPVTGLRRYANGALVSTAEPVKQGRILLFIHGTFSNNDNLIKEFAAVPDGAGVKLLVRLVKVLRAVYVGPGWHPFCTALDLDFR
jgi:hypothetical protein